MTHRGHFDQDKSVNVQNFNQLVGQILQKVLIDRNVKQTSYFPSRHKIKRMFELYLQQQSVESSEDVNYEYILCYILIKQYRRYYRQQLSSINAILPHLQKSSKQEEGVADKQLSRNHYTIHESNLLWLLDSLVRSNMIKEEKGKQRAELIRTQEKEGMTEKRAYKRKELIYDFNEIEQDAKSVLFKND